MYVFEICMLFLLIDSSQIFQWWLERSVKNRKGNEVTDFVSTSPKEPPLFFTFKMGVEIFRFRIIKTIRILKKFWLMTQSSPVAAYYRRVHCTHDGLSEPYMKRSWSPYAEPWLIDSVWITANVFWKIFCRVRFYDLVAGLSTMSSIRSKILQVAWIPDDALA